MQSLNCRRPLDYSSNINVSEGGPTAGNEELIWLIKTLGSKIWLQYCLSPDWQIYLSGHLALKVLNSFLESDVYAWPFSKNTSVSNRHSFLTNTQQLTILPLPFLLLHGEIWTHSFFSAPTPTRPLISAPEYDRDSYCVWKPPCRQALKSVVMSSSHFAWSIKQVREEETSWIFFQAFCEWGKRYIVSLTDTRRI